MNVLILHCTIHCTCTLCKPVLTLCVCVLPEGVFAEMPGLELLGAVSSLEDAQMLPLEPCNGRKLRVICGVSRTPVMENLLKSIFFGSRMCFVYLSFSWD